MGNNSISYYYIANKTEPHYLSIVDVDREKAGLGGDEV